MINKYSCISGIDLCHRWSNCQTSACTTGEYPAIFCWIWASFTVCDTGSNPLWGCLGLGLRLWTLLKSCASISVYSLQG